VNFLLRGSISWTVSRFGKGLILGFVGVDVLEAASSFDAANSPSTRISKAADHSCLMSKRAQLSLEELGGFTEVYHIDMSFSGGNYK